MAHVAELRQSTAATLLLGQFLDDTDGKTAETALTISQADVLLWKEGGTTLAQKNEATSCTHRSHGLYTCPVDTTDTNTLGILSVSVIETGALPIRQDYRVVTADEWDRKYTVTGAVPAFGIIDRGTAQSATGTTLVLRAAATFADDTVIGATLMAYGSSQGYWQTRSVTDYVLSTDTATVDTWTVTPSGTITYVLLAGAPASSSVLPTVLLSVGTGTGQVNVASGKVPATIAAGDLAANSLTASALATDAVTEIASAVVEAEITALKTYNRSANTTATITGPTSGSTSFGVTVDASYDPIATL
jgi:hypothetical protein